MQIVLLTHQFFPAHIGGTEVYTLELAHHAQRAGHSITVITYCESPSANPADYGPRFTSYDGIPLVEIHYNLSTAPVPARYEYDNQFTAIALGEILSQLNPGLVHVMHAMKLSASALEVCDRRNIPFIVTLCDFWFICPRHTLLKWDQTLCSGPAHPFACARCVNALHGFVNPPHILRDLSVIAGRNRFIRTSLLKARRIIALSNFQKRIYSRNGIPAQRIEVIPHGLDWSGEQIDKRRPEKPFQISYIGSLVEHKGVHVLLEALTRLPDLAVELNLFGALEPATPYIARLLDLGVGDRRIHFRGVFDPKELPGLMRSTDVLAMPSLWYENEPLVVKAALRAGVPTLASDLGTLADQITHGRTGWLVKAGDVSAWSEALRKAVSLLPDFKMDAIKIKSMEENAEEMLAIYAQVAQG